MTVPSETSRSSYTGNGVTTEFPTVFVFRTTDQLRVTYTPSGGTPTVWTEGSDYTVAGDDFSAGGASVMAAIAPAAGSSLVIERDVDFIQETDFTALGAFSPDTHEAALDHATYGLQELDRRVSDLEAAPAVTGDVVAGDGLEWAPAPTLRVMAGDGILVDNAGVHVGVIDDNQHGAQTTPTLHALATGGAHGFQSSTDKARQDALWARTVTAGAGLTGGGDLSANRTIDVVANADGSIVVNANDVQVGVLATDAQHGARGGGTQHALATGGAHGFMSSTDKAKLDGLASDNIATAIGTTSDAVPTTLYEFTPDDFKSEVVEVMVTGKNDAAAQGVAYVLQAGFRRHDGTTAQIGATATPLSVEDGALAGCAANILVTSSPKVTVQVTGIAATLIEWACRVVRRPSK